MILIRSWFSIKFLGFSRIFLRIVDEAGRARKSYRWVRRGLDIFSSSTQAGREARSFPEITTISIAGKMPFLIRRNTSRIFRLARFRITALPIFLEAMMPSLFLSNPFGRKNKVQYVPTRFLWPWAITFWNWGRFANLSVFGKQCWRMEGTRPSAFSALSFFGWPILFVRPQWSFFSETRAFASCEYFWVDTFVSYKISILTPTGI